MTFPLYSSTVFSPLTFSMSKGRAEGEFSKLFLSSNQNCTRFAGTTRKKTCGSLSCQEEKAPGEVTTSALHILVSYCPAIYLMDSFQAASCQPCQWWERALHLHLRLFFMERKWERLAIRKVSQDVLKKNITYAVCAHKSSTCRICAPKFSRYF